jgi:hypothetical protein
MDLESMKKLRLDRRLFHRRGGISDKELQKELDALPDVSDKLMTLGEANPSEESETDTPPAE